MVKVRVAYSTTPESGAIQWLEATQTSGKKHPFVYTQCEAILTRTLLPCQDTPAVKTPYDIKVCAPHAAFIIFFFFHFLFVRIVVINLWLHVIVREARG